MDAFCVQEVTNKLKFEGSMANLYAMRDSKAIYVTQIIFQR